MKKYSILLNELDRCDFIPDYQYFGALDNYTYNGISYAESIEAYSQLLDVMYKDFLSEWGTLSDAEKKAVIGWMDLIISKRYMHNEFFFDVPSLEIIDGMLNDNGVPRQAVRMARFIHDMAEQQKFYMQRVVEFLDINLRVYEQVELEDELCLCDIMNNETMEVSMDKTIYQTLHKQYGDTMTAKQLAEYFKVGTRTIYGWECKGYISNISSTSYETTSSGHKKRGEEKRYLTSDIAKNIEMQRKFNKL